MHVCLVGAKSCPPEIGGIEVFTFELGRRLAAKGVKVTVVVPRRKDREESSSIDGMDIRRTRAIRNRYALKISMMPEQFLVATSLRPDVLHANDPSSGVVGILSSRWKCSVVTVHGAGVSRPEWPTPFRQGGRLLQRLAVGGATAVTTTDSRTASLLTAYRKDIRIIPPGVDTEVFRKGKYDRPASFRDGKTNILFAGRLTKVKGVDLLLESLRHLRPDTLAKARLTIVGDGPMAPLVRDHERRTEALCWIGEISHERIPPYVTNADLLIMPSRSEGLPISMLEAMSANLPVASTIVGGIGDYFDDRHLTRIESITPEGVARAIEHALEDKELSRRKADAARELVQSRFSWDTITERYLRLYQEITS